VRDFIGNVIYAGLWLLIAVLVVALAFNLMVLLPKELADKSACEKRGGVFIDNGCYDLKVR
jgi:hypothetical protein